MKVVSQNNGLLDSSQSNNASWKPVKEIFQTKIYYEEKLLESCLHQVSLSNARS
jgi:hypothetical protein